MKQDQRQLLVNYFSQQPVRVAYLFGSQATGKAHSRSDYDFGVLFDSNLKPEIRFKKRLQIMSDLSKILGSDKIEVVDLETAPIYLAYSVIAPREIILVKDEKARINFEQRTFSLYFDRLYYLKRHTQESLCHFAGGSK